MAFEKLLSPVRIFELDDEIGKRIEGDGSVKNRSALLEHLQDLGVRMHPATNTLEITIPM